jgi:hypothetical protein
MNFHIHLFLVALIGFIIHTAVKLKSLQTKAIAGNFPFKASDYLKTDWLSFVISLSTILLAVWLSDEILHWNQKLQGWEKSIYSLIGYVSNDLASRIFGAYNKVINKVIDEKTNIADGKV